MISGTAISQGILFAATPFLSRIFSPEDFGVFSIYAATVSIIASVASWKYELAIMLPEKEKDVQALFVLSMLATLATAIVVFLLILVFRPLLVQYATDQINIFIWIVPLGVLFAGWLQVLISFGTKKKIFRSISITRASQAASGVGFQGAIGGFKLFSLGLVWGKLAGDIIAFFYLIIALTRKQCIHMKTVSREGIQVNARKYKDFPRYQSFAQLLSSLSQNVPYLMFSGLFSTEMAGFYMMSIRVLHAPTSLIARSTKEVYYQKAAALFAEGKSIHKLFKKTTFGLAKLGFIPFVLFGIFSVWIFSFVFGQEWETSGIYAQIILPWSFLGFMNPPSTASLYILGLQKFSLKYETSLVISRVLVIYLAFTLFNDDLVTLLSYSILGILFNAFLIVYCFRKSKTIINQ
ncbi:MAG: oligosaccharide flippase family protein [Bacteroidales bacterium]|nr:oligosaccharide flippase family protein [Bacteroidales bacterium]MCF8388444.1 oligosaccharide flippase family protein [Bacteroidales bacterium]MCF8398257.1 oligosaccharide flippase family protein [Bacteroidales bacterium]